jgi:hypothetical protein
MPVHHGVLLWRDKLSYGPQSSAMAEISTRMMTRTKGTPVPARRCSHPSGELIRPTKLFHKPATVVAIEAQKAVTQPMTARLMPLSRLRATTTRALLT